MFISDTNTPSNPAILEPAVYLRDVILPMDAEAERITADCKNILADVREAQLAYCQFDNLKFNKGFTQLTFESEREYIKGDVSVRVDGLVDITLTKSVYFTECYRVPLSVQQIHDAIILLHEGRIQDGKLIPLSEITQ